MGSFFDRLFGIEQDDNERIDQTEQVDDTSESKTTIQDVIDFVVELQSYYYNEVCKMQADLLIKKGMTQKEEAFFEKKIKQSQVTLAQIDAILEELKEIEKEYQSILGKSVYSFYDEIEKAKLEKVQVKVLKVVLKLCEVNTEPELDSIIAKRIVSYQKAWNVEGQLKLPKNSNAILIEGDGNTEKYRFGSFYKQVYVNPNEVPLTTKQLDQIRGLKLEFENEIQTDVVWVRVSGVTRLQLNYMRRTCIMPNDWEYDPEENDNLTFDIVPIKEIERYIKGVLQVVLVRNRYAVISMFAPTNQMLRIIGPTKQRGNKIEIYKKILFYIRERSKIYENNLMTTRLDRRHIPETLTIVPYLEFRNAYF